ncbi:MAG: Druantia anti-phage system protein DruA [Candidatus Acidoferrales bacterium]
MKRYCGRNFSGQEIGQLRDLIAENPGRTRAQLSRLACRLLEWRKADGGLKQMSCRVAMLRMHRQGLLQLPPPRNRKGGSGRIEHTFWSAPQAPLSRPVHELPGVHLEPVLSRPDSALWNEYIDRYHYLGYKPLPGAQLRYFACSEDRILALLGFGAAAWKTAPRDRFIGWRPSERERNLQLIVNNARFLILPWVQSKNLASKLLALAARQLPEDWHDRYAYRPVLLETFVDTGRFTGACYKAANWIHVGQTQGRGKLDRDRKADLPTKSIWLYPLTKHFRRSLRST